MEPYLTRTKITVCGVTGFDLALELFENEQVEVMNRYGYSAGDIPDIESSEVLKDTTYFYVRFPYGDDAFSIASDSDSKNIEVECDDTKWKVSAKKDGKGIYWGVMAADTRIISGNAAGYVEHILTFKSIKCNSVTGRTELMINKMNIGGLSRDLDLYIDKCPEPVLSNLQIVGEQESYNFGDTLKLSWDISDYMELHVKLDGAEIIQQDKHYETTDLPVKYEPYVVEVSNDANSVKQYKISCNISTIVKFEIVKIDKESVTFNWEADEKNVVECSIATIATNIEFKGEETFNKKISSDQTFRFLAVLKDGIHTAISQIQFSCPVIEKFNMVSNDLSDDADGVRNCRKNLEGKVKDGFLSADYLLTHLDDEKVFFPCHLTCKSGPTPPIKYTYKYAWEARNAEKYNIVMDNGDRSNEFEATVTEGEITTTSENSNATLYAVGEHGYTAERHT